MNKACEHLCASCCIDILFSFFLGKNLRLELLSCMFIISCQTVLPSVSHVFVPTNSV